MRAVLELEVHETVMFFVICWGWGIPLLLLALNHQGPRCGFCSVALESTARLDSNCLSLADQAAYSV